MKNFDSFIGVDWSGAKEVYTNAIAVARCDKGDEPPFLVQNPTGHKLWSRYDVLQYLSFLKHQNKRVLVGIDANFGYCHDVGKQHFGLNYTAQQQWKKVDDICQKTNNLYASDFWTSQKYKQSFWVNGKQPAWFDAQVLSRETERSAKEMGLGNPESPFKFIGSKQVGKGGLSVQRLAHQLSIESKEDVSFWPFDTREVTDNSTVVLTEIYPRLFIRLAQLGNKKITVLNQDNLNMAYKVFKTQSCDINFEFTDHDTDALISAAGLRYLCGQGKTIPDMISQPSMMSAVAKKCEGWIFGVGVSERI